MRKLTIDELRQLVPEYNNDLAKERASGIFNYIIMMVALARDHHMQHQDLVNWIHRHFEERGYYEETLLKFGSGNTKLFLQDFVIGRSLLYENIEVFIHENGNYEVQSTSWWLNQPTDACFYFDMEPEEIVKYVQSLACSKADRLGITLKISHNNGIEQALICKKDTII
ncbi:hypothetical protein [Paenibacillus sp. MZ03-122A]|uniref:hypothetical protein n=1 Tax=Paenibacillus sp. MZ03-122A TaxID=2962033 RepID=UPI0020B73E9F|nr:hypothetical protein [Paenibacillus sp. MZ03-122A]MCP3780911.1 hypothetical protein [Paenibacillus sp. MZ03-122A]